MKVNIVMLVHNRHKLTWQALTTLYKNTPESLFNLTIIDDDSRDSLGDNDPLEDSLNRMVRMGDNWTSLRISPSKNITGQARNLGVYWAEKYWGRGEYLYLSDNDMYFKPGWLPNCIGALESVTVTNPPRQFSLIGGWNHPFLQPTQEHKVSHSQLYVAEHDAVAGASQIMRWETWDKHGPLDAHATGVGQSEDWKFCQDIIKDGGVIGSVYPRVVLNCGITNSFGKPSPGADEMLKELQEAKKQYPDLYWG